MNPQPSIGRTVHFVLDNGEHRPAVITRVHGGDVVNLHVLHDAADATLSGGRPAFDATPTSVPLRDPAENLRYTWHWPEPAVEATPAAVAAPASAEPTIEYATQPPQL